VLIDRAPCWTPERLQKKKQRCDGARTCCVNRGLFTNMPRPGRVCRSCAIVRGAEAMRSIRRIIAEVLRRGTPALLSMAYGRGDDHLCHDPMKWSRCRREPVASRSGDDAKADYRWTVRGAGALGLEGEISIARGGGGARVFEPRRVDAERFVADPFFSAEPGAPAVPHGGCGARHGGWEVEFWVAMKKPGAGSAAFALRWARSKRRAPPVPGWASGGACERGVGGEAAGAYLRDGGTRRELE